MEESNHNEQHHHHVPAPTASFDGPSTSSVSTSELLIEENNDEPAGNIQNQEQRQEHPSSSAVSYRLDIPISNVAANRMRDDALSCLAVLVAFWFFASLTVILGYYGSVNLELGPNSSLLVKPNPLFVQSLKAEELGERKPGPILYGFYKSPPLNVEITWTQKHNAVVPVDSHKEWVIFLNKGSKADISYCVKSPIASPLSLVIAQGTESLLEWIGDPSYPNTTLSWNIIHGSGNIQQEIPKSSTYYIAVGNLNSEKVEVELKFIVNSLIYDTSQAYYSCSLSNHLCGLQLFLLGTTAGVLTSPGPTKGASNEDWHVKLSYGPRWIIYVIGSGVMAVLLLVALRLCNVFRPSGRHGYQAGEIESERTPLLSQKDDDNSSWGSSYDSNSHEEEDLEKWLTANCEEKLLAEGENLRRLCVICFDAPRECFFLPCGHCAACFTCGTRIAEEAGTCPICRRSMKKVRKIFSV